MRARGERHGRAKLTLWDVCAIRALFLPPMPRLPVITRIATAFGISERQVRKIRDGMNWR